MNDRGDRKSNRRRNAAIVAVIIIVLVVWFLSIHHDIDVDMEGKGTVTPDGVTVGHLGSATLEFVPADGWVLKEVLLDGKPVELDDGKLVLKQIVSDHKVEAVFVETGHEEEHTLTVTSDGDGSVSPSGTVSYPAGSEVSVTATPDDGYVIDDVKVDGQSVGSRNIITVTMDSDRSVEVVFRVANDTSSGTAPADPWVDISVDVQIITTGAEFGTVEPSGKVRVAYGGSLTVTIQLNEGYTLESVTADGVPMGRSTVVTVENVVADVDINIVVSHTVRTYTVTASASSGGTITPNGGIEVIEGEDVTFTISPNRGYRLSSLLVDGKSVGSGISSYTIEDVRKDTVVRATFESTSPGPSPQPVKKLVSISVPSHPEYCYIDQNIEGSIQVVAEYSDGSSETVTGTCSQTSWTEAGQKTVTVSYGGKTCTFELTVPTLSGIEVTTKPAKTVFAVGEKISLNGMVVTAYYSDGPTRRVTASYAQQSFTEAGAEEVTISYSEGGITETTTLQVTIVDDGGFKAIVTAYSGTRVENGAVVSFSYPTMSKSLKEFKFDTSNIVPGISQTVQITVTNGSRTTLDACIYVSSISEANELSEQIQLSSGDRTSTVRDTADRSFIDLGWMDPGSTQTFSLTMTFVEGPDNNQAMGKSLKFTLGVFAAQETG